MTGVYALFNAQNGKCYVGQAVDIRRRWAHHRWALRTGRHTNGHLQNAWKANWRSFVFAVLEECAPDDLDETEKKWVAVFRANEADHGYNLTTGGDGIRGLIRTPEHRKHLSESLKGRKSPMLGKRFTEHHRKKIAEALRGNANSHFGKDNHASRAVRCVDTGESFDCAADAGLRYGSRSDTPGTNILKCCKGQRPAAFGLRWEFL